MPTLDYEKRFNYALQKKTVIATNSQNFYNGIKLHLITHLSSSKMKYGAFIRTTDTQLLELAHKENVKYNYESTNKNNNSVRKQLLVNRRRVLHCDNIINYQDTTLLSSNKKISLHRNKVIGGTQKTKTVILCSNRLLNLKVTW